MEERVYIAKAARIKKTKHQNKGSATCVLKSQKRGTTWWKQKYYKSAYGSAVKQYTAEIRDDIEDMQYIDIELPCTATKMSDKTNGRRFGYMRCVRALITLFFCAFLLASCTVPKEPYQSSLILYDTTDDVKALFSSKQEAFLQISELMEREVSFFYENDDSIRPNLQYDYSRHFSDDEWTQINDFMVTTGLYSIEYARIIISNETAKTRFGIRIRYNFSTRDGNQTCSIASLSNDTDQEIAAKFIQQALDFPGVDIRVEQLGEGWYFIIENWK